MSEGRDIDAIEEIYQVVHRAAGHNLGRQLMLLMSALAYTVVHESKDKQEFSLHKTKVIKLFTETLDQAFDLIKDVDSEGEWPHN
jgi:hypothetical protein